MASRLLASLRPEIAAQSRISAAVVVSPVTFRDHIEPPWTAKRFCGARFDGGRLVKATRILCDRRNQLMHSLYRVGDGGERLARWKASTRGGRWKGDMEEIGLSDLNEFANLLGEGIGAADKLLQRLHGYPGWHGR